MLNIPNANFMTENFIVRNSRSSYRIFVGNTRYHVDMIIDAIVEYGPKRKIAYAYLIKISDISDEDNIKQLTKGWVYTPNFDLPSLYDILQDYILIDTEMSATIVEKY